MLASRKKICKCGIDAIDLLNDIKIFDENIVKVDIEKLPTYMESFKLSTNSIYGGIRKVEESCEIDATNQWHTILETDNKVDELPTINERTRFGEKKLDILSDLSQIKYQITEKMRNCSKQ